VTACIALVRWWLSQSTPDTQIKEDSAANGLAYYALQFMSGARGQFFAFWRVS